MTSSDVPTELLALARDVASGRHQVPGMSQARAVCLLARQALEEIVDAMLAKQQLACTEASMRARLICLSQAFASDPGNIGHRAEIAWRQLSSACHHHAYKFSPTGGEALALVDQVVWLEHQRMERA